MKSQLLSKPDFVYKGPNDTLERVEKNNGIDILIYESQVKLTWILGSKMFH
jgi:hypothetical protein